METSPFTDNSKTKNGVARALIVLVAVAAVCAITFFAADSNVRKSKLEIAAGLREGDRILHALSKCSAEITADSFSIDAGADTPEISDEKYRAFKEGHLRRMAVYQALEEDLGAARSAGMADDSARRLGSLTGLFRSMDQTVNHCVDSLMYSSGLHVEASCYLSLGPIQYLLKEIEEAQKQYLISKEKAKNLSWIDHLRRSRQMPLRIRDSGGHNIILLLVDALRADELTVYGAGRVKMPFLEKLTREGVVFEDVTSASSVTHTSVASLFSGLDPWEVNGWGARKWDNSKSLIPEFKKLGYETAGFSANPLISGPDGFASGFDYFAYRKWAPAIITAGEIWSFLEYRRRGDAPLFCYSHIIDPHDPYFSPDSVPALAAKGRPGGFIPDPKPIEDELIPQGIDPLTVLPSGNLEYLREIYSEESAYADKWLERIFELFNRKGLLENATVVIIADHGEEFLDHGNVRHGKQLYQELVHVPLIIWGRLPGALKPGDRVNTPHSLMELIPSLLADADGKLPDRAASRARLFSGSQPEKPIVSVTNGCTFDLKTDRTELAVLRSGNFKLILDVAGGESRLFDLAADPGEKNNLSTEMKDRADAMTQELLRIRAASLRFNTTDKNPAPEIDRKLKDIGYIQ